MPQEPKVRRLRRVKYRQTHPTIHTPPPPFPIVVLGQFPKWSWRQVEPNLKAFPGPNLEAFAFWRRESDIWRLYIWYQVMRDKDDPPDAKPRRSVYTPGQGAPILLIFASFHVPAKAARFYQNVRYWRAARDLAIDNPEDGIYAYIRPARSQSRGELHEFANYADRWEYCQRRLAQEFPKVLLLNPYRPTLASAENKIRDVTRRRYRINQNYSSCTKVGMTSDQIERTRKMARGAEQRERWTREVYAKARQIALRHETMNRRHKLIRDREGPDSTFVAPSRSVSDHPVYQDGTPEHEEALRLLGDPQYDPDREDNP